MDNEQQESVAREIRRKLRDIEATKSSGPGSTSSTKGQQKLRQKRKFGFFRIFITLIVAIGIGGVVIPPDAQPACARLRPHRLLLASN